MNQKQKQSLVEGKRLQDIKSHRITLRRSRELNALCADLIAGVAKELDAVAEDDSVHSVILCGEKNFAAGADIEELLRADASNDLIEAWECIARFRKPIIAAVDGYALGGGMEIMMMCDIVIASLGARFGQPEIKLGIIPGAGATQRLPRRVGAAHAADLLLTGRMINADEALAMGLVSRVCPADKLSDVADGIAKELSFLSLPALVSAKRAMAAAQSLSLDKGIEFERAEFYRTLKNNDAKIGLEAFLNKERAKFGNS